MTSQQPLFDRAGFVSSEALAEAEAAPAGQPRLRCAVRAQVIMYYEALDALIPPEHAAHSIWAYVSQLDLSPLLAQIKAVEGHEGRPPADPRILLTLWLYATVEGIGSARELARLCETDAAYQWIAGGVPLNHHTLSDFRADQGPLLDRLLTQSVASLMAAGVVDLNRVAQDGMRVRTSAGGKTFRRRAKLEEYLAAAGEQVERLKAEGNDDPAAGQRRIQAARRRAAQERKAQHRGGAWATREDRGPKARLETGIGPGLHHRFRGPLHEDGGRGLSPGVQRPVRDRHENAGDRRRQRHQRRQRQRRNGPHAPANPAALWPRPRRVSGRRGFRHQKRRRNARRRRHHRLHASAPVEKIKSSRRKRRGPTNRRS